jgi:TraY domain
MIERQLSEGRTQVSVIMDEQLRARLEVAARRAVRTLSGEINFRLKRSLECDRPLDSDIA